MNKARILETKPGGTDLDYWGIFEAVSDGLIIVDRKSQRVVEANSAAAAMHGYSREEFIGLPLSETILPVSQHIFTEASQAVKPGSMLELSTIHICQDGSTFHAEWHATAFIYQGKRCLLGMVRDVSRLIRADQHLHQRITARTREQSTLLEISHTLASTLELQPGMILEQLGEIIEYTHAGLFGLEDSTLTALALRSGNGHGNGSGNGSSKRPAPKPLEQAAPFKVRLDGPKTLATLFNGHRPIRIADVTGHDPAARFLHSLLTGEASVLLKGVQAWMWVPLAVKGRIIGGLGIAHARRNFFTAHHAALALAMADQVAITMVNAELYEHARELAVIQERQHLAQNLHDAVNQSLFSAGLIAEVLPRLWDRDQDEARRALEDLRRLTRGAQAEMRELLAELRPSVLTDSSLGELLRQLANAFTGRTNIPVIVNLTGEHVLPADLQVALYRICQEALNNTAKHAKASQVEIDLQYETAMVASAMSIPHPLMLGVTVVKSVQMRIHDDGLGFEPDEVPTPGHYGLGMMHERAEEVGAQLTFSSQPGNGTEVTLHWPGPLKKEA